MKVHVAALALLVCMAGSAEAGKRKNKQKSPAVQPTKQERITLPCSWEPGTTWTYESLRMRTDSRAPEMAQLRTRTPITVTWNQPGSQGTATWTFGASRFEGLPAGVTVNEEMNMAGTLLKDVPIEVRINDGVVTGIDNFETVIAAIEPIFELLEKDSPEAAQMTRELFADPEQGPLLMLRDIAPFWAMTCITMLVGEEISAPTQFPNPFGGPSIPGVESVRLVSVDPKTNSARLETVTSAEPEALITAVQPILERMLPAGATEEQIAAALAQLPPIDTRSHGVFHMSLEDGMPISIEVVRTVGAGQDVTKSDSWGWQRQ